MTQPNPNPRKVAVLGASDKPDRYSNLLIRRLLAKGHQVFPVNPALTTIEGVPVFKRVEDLPPGLDVLSIYMNEGRSREIAAAILATGIPKVVFNPGAENPDLERSMAKTVSQPIEACSLVLLSMDQL
jgi:predicted CoA-binding protein